jgi:copper oxidase (laccase) domain-containing protein
MSSVSVLELESGLCVVSGGTELGNVDPRFSEIEAVERARAAGTGILNASRIHVIQPQNKTDFEVVESSTPSHDDRLNEIAMPVDGLITLERGVGVMANTADCIPLVIAEPEKDILSILHIGWRAAVYGLADKVIDHLIETTDFDPKNATAIFGPSIGPSTYVTDALHPVQASKAWEDNVSTSYHGYHIDIPGNVAQALKQRGVSDIIDFPGKLDTGTDADYFSHNRRLRSGIEAAHDQNDAPVEPEGRNLFVAMLKAR